MRRQAFLEALERIALEIVDPVCAEDMAHDHLGQNRLPGLEIRSGGNHRTGTRSGSRRIAKDREATVGPAG